MAKFWTVTSLKDFSYFGPVCRKVEWNFYLQTSKLFHKGKGGAETNGERLDQKNFMIIITVKPMMVG